MIDELDAFVDRLIRILSAADVDQDCKVASERLYRCAQDIVEFLRSHGYSRDAAEVEAYMRHIEPTYGAPRINRLTEEVDFYKTRLVVLTEALSETTHRKPTRPLPVSPATNTKASQPNSITIQNFQGILGDVQGSTVHQDLAIDVRPNDLSSLSQTLKGLGLETSDIDELKRAIDKQAKPTDSSNLGAHVGPWVGKMVGKAASGVWKIAAGTAAGLLTRAIASYYGLP